MNTSELEDFVQLMIKEHPDYKNRIIDLYQLCLHNIRIEIMSMSSLDGSKKIRIETCITSIKELVNA